MLSATVRYFSFNTILRCIQREERIGNDYRVLFQSPRLTGSARYTSPRALYAINIALDATKYVMKILFFFSL